MPFLQKIPVASGPTDGAGAVTFYSPRLTGRLVQIQYVKVDFAAGVDFAITVEGTAQGVWTEANVDASTVRMPRTQIHGVDGAPAIYAAGGAYVQDYIQVFDDRIKFVITNGGALKNGTFYVLID